MAAVDRPQPRMAGDAVPEGHASVSAALRRLHPRQDDRRDVRAAVEHADQRRSAAPGSTGAADTTSRLNGTWYARSRWDEWGSERAGRGRAERDGRAHLREVQRGRVPELLPRAVSEDSTSTPAGSAASDLDRFVQYQFGMFDDTRIHGVPASGVRFGELAMVRGSVLAERLRDLPAGPVPGACMGSRATSDPGLAADPGHRRRGELSRAVEYHPARRRRQERAARPLQWSRIHDAAGAAPETTRMTGMHPLGRQCPAPPATRGVARMSRHW